MFISAEHGQLTPMTALFTAHWHQCLVLVSPVTLHQLGAQFWFSDTCQEIKTVYQKPTFSNGHMTWENLFQTGSKNALYSLRNKVSSSPMVLLHLDPPQVNTKALMNARPHSLSVFVLSCVRTCVKHRVHNSVASRSTALMLIVVWKNTQTVQPLLFPLRSAHECPKSFSAHFCVNVFVFFFKSSLCAFNTGCWRSQCGNLGWPYFHKG